MKAQEYFDKYFASVKSFEEIAENGKAMFRDMAKEYNEIARKRNIKTYGGAVGVVRELNDKWNSVAGKVEKKFSTKVIKRNVIWNVFLSEEWGDTFPRKPD